MGFSELLPSPVNDGDIMCLFSSLLSFLHMSEAGPSDATREATHYFIPRGGDAGRVLETCWCVDGRFPGDGQLVALGGGRRVSLRGGP